MIEENHKINYSLKLWLEEDTLNNYKNSFNFGTKKSTRFPIICRFPLNNF